MNTINLTILEASAGNKLYNEADKIIGEQVQLADDASATAWREITDTEAEALQAQWAAERKAAKEAALQPPTA